MRTPRRRARQARCSRQAVLCWTEYYNGKWQPTKTSDVNLPTVIGSFDPPGPARSRAVRDLAPDRARPAHGHEPGPRGTAGTRVQHPADALILAITGSRVRAVSAASSCTTRTACRSASTTSAPGTSRRSATAPFPSADLSLARSVIAPILDGPCRTLRQRHVRHQLPARPGQSRDLLQQPPQVQLAAALRRAAARAARRVGRAVPLRGPPAPVLRDDDREAWSRSAVPRLRASFTAARRARSALRDAAARAAPAGAAATPPEVLALSAASRRPGRHAALHRRRHEHQGRPGAAAAPVTYQGQVISPTGSLRDAAAATDRTWSRTSRGSAPSTTPATSQAHPRPDPGAIGIRRSRRPSPTTSRTSSTRSSATSSAAQPDSVAGMLDPDFLGSLHHAYSAADYTLLDSEPVTVTMPDAGIDVVDRGPYANYNWELLYHIPVMIAVHLSNNQRFAEAQKWFHLVFDPTSTDTTCRRRAVLEVVRVPDGTASRTSRADHPAEHPDGQLDPRPGQDQVGRAHRLQRHPGQPVRPARRGPHQAERLPVVRRDEVPGQPHRLGRQPVPRRHHRDAERGHPLLRPGRQHPGPAAAGRCRGRAAPAPRNFVQLKQAGLDRMADALVTLEGPVPVQPRARPRTGRRLRRGRERRAVRHRAVAVLLPSRRTRTCSPTGTPSPTGCSRSATARTSRASSQQLPLFDPPLDPGMLVQAAAAGIDIGSIVSGLNQPVGPVRSPAAHPEGPGDRRRGPLARQRAARPPWRRATPSSSRCCGRATRSSSSR